MKAGEHACTLCAGRVTDLLDFGPQPVCNRFLPAPDANEYSHDLALGQCESCALVQIVDPVPIAELASRYEWVVYREPEDHLDALARVIAELPGITPESVVAGLSTVDDSLLRRLRQLGLSRQWRLDTAIDLGEDVYPPGVQLVQARLDAGLASRLAATHGRPDVLIGRFLLEHAQDASRFLAGIKALIGDGGYVVVEVPDCRKAQETGDYSAVWEEHALYFTEVTLQEAFRRSGFEVVRFVAYPYAIQDSLVLIARPTAAPAAAADALGEERARWRAWVRELPGTRARVRRFLGDRARGGRLAMFGAAQRGCSFINLLELQSELHAVLDDDPRKQGYYMPGSRAPILPSSALQDGGYTLCLLAARPESQEQLRRAHASFSKAGGSFISIYPDATSGLPLLTHIETGKNEDHKIQS